MTTIAYRDGVVATDTLLVSGSVIVDHCYEKTITKEGVMFFLSGAISDYNKLIEEYFTPTARDIGDVSAIVIDKGSVIKVGREDGGKGIWRCVERRENYISIGSGQDFALSAMDFGRSAKEAVEYAMKRDIYTGGEVKVYRV